MVAIVQLVEHWIVIPGVKGSSPFSHPIHFSAGVAELVDAPDLGSGAYGVRVRVPSPAPYHTFLTSLFKFKLPLKIPYVIRLILTFLTLVYYNKLVNTFKLKCMHLCMWQMYAFF